MKNRCQVTQLESVEREKKIKKKPTLGQVLFTSFFWILITIVESYLWIFKTPELVQWVKDLKDVWLGIALGAGMIIGLYIYCYCKHYAIRLKHLNIPSVYSIVTILITIARFGELIMVFSHLSQFASLWADGILPFILFMWISGTAVMAVVFMNFIRKDRIRRRRRSSQSKNVDWVA